MIFSMIAAIGKNNELGKGNQLIWKLPADMKHFRTLTSGHPVIMGRKTFESIGRPLPNRRNVVVTRDTNYSAEGVEIVHSLEEASALFKDPNEEVFNIGGGELYKQGMQYADKLYITHVDGQFEADVFFPTIGPEWEKVSEEYYEKDSENAHAYSFVEYKNTAK
jgi:dihydrofolate reductase